MEEGELMGRGSQLYWFLNMEIMPTVQQQKYIFSHLYISDDIKKMQIRYRKELLQMVNSESVTSDSKEE